MECREILLQAGVAERSDFTALEVRRLLKMMSSSSLWEAEEIATPLLYLKKEISREELLVWIAALRRDASRMILFEDGETLLKTWGEVSCFLLDVFGERSASVAARITGVSLGTARGWMRGRVPAARNRAALQDFAEGAFHLRYKMGLTYKEARLIAEERAEQTLF